MGEISVEKNIEVYVDIDIDQSDVVQYLRKYTTEIPEIFKRIGIKNETIHVLPIEPKTLNDQRKIDFLTWAYNNLSLETIESLMEEENVK